MNKNLVETAKLRAVWRLMLAGLAALLPLIGTLWVLVLVYNILLRVGDAMVRFVLRIGSYAIGRKDAYLDWQWDFPGANLLRFFLPLLLVLLVGMAVLNQPGRVVMAKLDALLKRLPMLGFVYSGLKQFVDALKGLGGERKFQSVVYVEYPSPGCRLLGFVTGNFRDKIREKKVISVFIPTSPNPMTGILVVVDEDKIELSDMTIEQASKMIISAGLVTPDHLGDAVKIQE